MADSILGRLSVRIGADVGALRQDMQRAEGVILGSLGGLKSQVAAIFGGLGVGAAISQSLRFADDLVETADAIGLTVERFQELRFVAQQSGISAEQFAQGMGILARKAGEAGKTTEQAFADVIARMAAAKTQAERVAIAMEAFGRGGRQFALAFGQGAAAVNDLIVQLRTLNGVVGEDTLRKVAEANDRIDAFATIVRSRAVVAVGFLIEKLEQAGQAWARTLNVLSGASSILSSQERFNALLTERDAVLKRIEERQGKLSFRWLREGDEERLADINAELDKMRVAREQLDRAAAKSGPIDLMLQGRRTADLSLGPYTSAQDEAQFFERRLSTTRRMTDADRAAAQAARDLANEVSGLYESTRTPLETLNQEWARLDELLAQGAISWDVYARATIKATDQLDEISRQTQEVSDLGADIGLTFSSAFEDAIAGGEKFSEVLRALGEDLLRLVTRQLITEPLARSFAGFDFAGLLSSFLPGRAGGGTVYPGQAYVVGERGPEVLVPGTAGRVLPGVGGGVTVNVIEAPGRGGQMQQTTRGGRSVVDVMVERIKSAVASDILRGAGPVSAALERTYGATRAAGAF